MIFFFFFNTAWIKEKKKLLEKTGDNGFGICDLWLISNTEMSHSHWYFMQMGVSWALTYRRFANRKQQSGRKEENMFGSKHTF